jgi:hypothetical protein
MQVQHVGGSCGGAGCPTLYATDRGTYLVQGYVVSGKGVAVAVPRSLVASAKISPTIRSPRADTLVISGRPVPIGTVSGLRTVEEGEALVEIPASALTPRAQTFEFTEQELDSWRHAAAAVIGEREVAGVGVA